MNAASSESPEERVQTYDCLSVLGILYVSSGKDSLDRGEGSSGLSNDISSRVDVDLSLEQRRCWLVSCSASYISRRIAKALKSATNRLRRKVR